MYEKITQQLSTGLLEVNINRSEVQYEDLFSFAERQNPKRSFLFVSKVLGKHIPVSPKKMKNIYQKLANDINPKKKEGVLFIGMAETALGLAAGVYKEVAKKLKDPLLLATTRHKLNAELLCEFSEDHSHATEHRIYYAEHSKGLLQHTQFSTIVLIDDEATTGKTFNNLLNALFEAQSLNLSQLFEIVTVVCKVHNLSHSLSVQTKNVD